LPPSTWTASVVTRIAASEATILAIAPGFVSRGSSCAIAVAAWYVSARAPAMSASIWASLNWIPWWPISGWPKACRRSA
jgi:hypothetical protein